MRMARDAGMDLVEVAPTARPPVCRIMDYGKWKYTQKKHQKKSHEQQLKEVRLRPKTDTNDRKIKLNRAIKFFKAGHKVQFTMQFRGRERFHREIAFDIFKSILDEFGERVKVDRRPSMEGRHMITILVPVKGAFDDVPMPSGADDVDIDENLDNDADIDTDLGRQRARDQFVERGRNPGDRGIATN